MRTPRLLPVSLAANLLLLGALGYLGLVRPAPRQPRESAPLPPPPAAEARRVQDVLQPTPAPVALPRFQWSQIESPDYPTYIANLRSIACPEQTIWDIISADVENLYAQKRRELQARGLGALDLAREMEALRQQQGELLVHLLGGGQSSVPGAIAEQQSPATKPTPDAPMAKRSPPVLIPVALLPPDPSLNLTQSQKEDWENMTKEFIEAVGGPNQNPNDPEYLRRWKEARATFDEEFKTRLGVDLYIKASLDRPGAQ